MAVMLDFDGTIEHQPAPMTEEAISSANKSAEYYNETRRYFKDEDAAREYANAHGIEIVQVLNFSDYSNRSVKDIMVKPVRNAKTLNVSKEVHERLEKLAHVTGKSKARLVQEGVEHLERENLIGTKMIMRERRSTGAVQAWVTDEDVDREYMNDHDYYTRVFMTAKEAKAFAEELHNAKYRQAIELHLDEM